MIVKTNIKRLIVLLLFAFTSGCTDGERFDSIENPVSLIDNISSYQSLDALKASLGSVYPLDTLPDERSSFSGDKFRPPFQVKNLLVRDFLHLGQRGNLLVIFFNNRLAKTLFFPSNHDEYLATLSSKIGTDVISSKGILIRPHVRIWAATDHQGKSYIGWEDERLADEMNRWIKKFARNIPRTTEGEDLCLSLS